MAVKLHCPSCGQIVQADSDMEDGREVFRCEFCTLILKEEAPVRVVFPRVLIAEDTVLLRQILRDALIGERISNDVYDCKDGEELIGTATELHIQNKSIDLAIIDLSMPVLNGYHAAIALRAIERAFKHAATPVIFFTGHGADDNLRKMLEACAPARYLNKGNTTMDKIASRLTTILQTLRRAA